MSKCRSCKAEIMWVTMEKSGKKNPLDAESSLDGNIAIVTIAGNERTARAVKNVEREGLLANGVPLYKSHFTTCPDSKLFKNPQAREDSRQPDRSDARTGHAGASAAADNTGAKSS